VRGHKKTPRWRRIEAAVCAAEGLPHLGGPGAPDCPGVEVKDRARPVDRSVVEHDLIRYAKREDLLHTYYSTSGFTEGAEEALLDAGVEPVDLDVPKRPHR